MKFEDGVAAGGGRRHTAAAAAGKVAATLLVVTVAAGTFASCDDDAESPTPDSGVTEPNAALTLPAPTEEDPLIPVRGRLAAVEDCLVLGSTLVMWPYGTSWEVGSKEVHLANGEVFTLGAMVKGSGGIRTLGQPLPAPDVFGESTNAAIRACEEVTGFHALSILYNTEAN